MQIIFLADIDYSSSNACSSYELSLKTISEREGKKLQQLLQDKKLFISGA